MVLAHQHPKTMTTKMEKMDPNTAAPTTTWLHHCMNETNPHCACQQLIRYAKLQAQKLISAKKSQRFFIAEKKLQSNSPFSSS
jgi:hypothetical protein